MNARIQGGLLRQPITWLVVCLFLAATVLAYPMYVIRPFRHQAANELALALEVLQIRTLLELSFVLVAVVLAVWSWRTHRRTIHRVIAATLALLVIACAFGSRINVYERMFHPLDRPIFSAASQSRLDGAEQVIAITINGAARAYPIRSMSYHHIVNDVVGGVPIVATY